MRACCPGWGGPHCTDGKYPRRTGTFWGSDCEREPICDVAEVTDCLRTRQVWLGSPDQPDNDICVPHSLLLQPLLKPALKATALSHGSANLQQAQLILQQEAWKNAVPNPQDTAGGTAAPRCASAVLVSTTPVPEMVISRPSPSPLSFRVLSLSTKPWLPRGFSRGTIPCCRISCYALTSVPAFRGSHMIYLVQAMLPLKPSCL